MGTSDFETDGEGGTRTLPDEPSDAPVHHGPTDTDEHAVPEPSDLGTDPEEHPIREPDRDALIDYVHQLAHRTVFLETALTSVIEELLTRRIFPSDAIERIIGQAEEKTAALPDPLRMNKGRNGLVAGFVESD